MDLRLPAAAGELTRAEQKILDYINTNTDTFLFSSIGQLAERLELSDATVSRFARHVGCRDFKALLEAESGLPVVLWDERRSSIEAHAILHANGKKEKKHRKTVDAVAAGLILEGYLGSLKR